MKQFKDFLKEHICDHDNESNIQNKDLFESGSNPRHVTVYHGDNHGTNKLDPKLMNNGNNQEGIGIYFSDILGTAESYGQQVVQVTVDISRLVESRKPVSLLKRGDVVNMMQHLAKVDQEAMFYLVTDYGVYLEEPEELEAQHVNQLYPLIRTEEIRNFQILMAESFGVESFVAAWNKYIKLDGTWYYNSERERWFAIINPTVKVQKVGK